MTGGRHATTAVPGLAQLLASQAGLARRAQLRELGIVRQAVANQVAAGRWRMVAPEVVSVDNGRLDLEQLLWRAVLAAAGVVVLRIPAYAVRHHPDEVVARLREIRLAAVANARDV